MGRVVAMTRTWVMLVLLSGWAACVGAQPATFARHATLPAGSPDGRHVVFCSDRDGGAGELYVAEIATGLQRRLTHSPEAENGPAWSDSGRRIVYRVAHGDTTELRSVAADGSDMRTLLQRVAKGMTLSGDGRRVAYTVGTWTRNRIWVADADGSHARALTDSSSGYFNLAWSPDCGVLAVTRRDSSGALQLRLVSPDSARSRELVRLPASRSGRPGPRTGGRLRSRRGRTRGTTPRRAMPTSTRRTWRVAA